MTCGIYVITNTKSGKRYVGVSRNIESRWGAHRSGLDRGKHVAKSLQDDWFADGADAFRFEILESCDWKEFQQKEPHYIRQYRCNEPEYGYNTIYKDVMKYRHPMQYGGTDWDDDIDPRVLDRIEARIDAMLATMTDMTRILNDMARMTNDMERLLQAVQNRG